MCDKCKLYIALIKNTQNNFFLSFMCITFVIVFYK